MGKIDIELPSYMGRGIIGGLTKGYKEAALYFIEGRSPPSRRRKLGLNPVEGIVRVDVNSETSVEEMMEGGGNPDLLLYNAMRGDKDGLLVVSNGFQTDCDPVWEGEGREKENLKGSKPGGGIYYLIKRLQSEEETPESPEKVRIPSYAIGKSLEECGSEVDGLRTARIAYALELKYNPVYHHMGIVVRPRDKKGLMFPDDKIVNYSRLMESAGEFIMFATYGVHGPSFHDALPPDITYFRDWAKKIRLDGLTPEELVEEVWKTLPEKILVGVAAAMRDEFQPSGFNFAVKNMQE
jgi:hypothetical protein